MTGQDGAAVQTLNGLKDVAEPDWPYRDSLLADSQPPGYAAGLVSLSYLKAAWRRSVRLWLALAVIGLVIGVAYKIAVPTPYQATTTILLPQDQQSIVAITADATLAQSRTVAGLAVRRLGLAQSAASFAKTYSVAAPTSDVLVVTAAGPSASDAISRANTLAAVFLKFRANLEVAQEDVTVRSLGSQISGSERQIRLLNQRISGLSAGPPSAANETALADLQAQLGQAENTLTTANAGVQTAEQAAALQVRTSNVLDAAALTQASMAKPFLLAAAIGLVAGLMLGLGFVTVRALASDKLRQRDDVAFALGSSVKLSVGPIGPWQWLPSWLDVANPQSPGMRWVLARMRAAYALACSARLGASPVFPRRWLPSRLDLASPQNPDIRRVVAQLRSAVPGENHGTAALAVVPVDDNLAAAPCVAALAVACAREGSRVVLVDLTGRRLAARLLHVCHAGITTAKDWSERLVVATPSPADPLPVGPRSDNGSRDPAAGASELMVACTKADVLLVAANLDPAAGGDHLATWAADAAVLVTAGRSSGMRIHAVAEMLRLARIRLASAVIIGADDSDHSIGVLAPAAVGWPDEVQGPGSVDRFPG
jgi:capsular polysaccharide biosynthesis protein